MVDTSVDDEPSTFAVTFVVEKMELATKLEEGTADVGNTVSLAGPVTGVSVGGAGDWKDSEAVVVVKWSLAGGCSVFVTAT